MYHTEIKEAQFSLNDDLVIFLNPFTPKGAYLGKCPNCPWGSGIMVTTERQI